mgnify:FL=1|jgi:uncharacterized membrane protein (Fun14 family)
MNQTKFLQLWASLQEREKKLITIVLAFIVIILMTSYLLNISSKISLNKRSLAVAQDNFMYVHDQANNYQQYWLAQEVFAQFPAASDFILSESQRFLLQDFQLGEEGDRVFFVFKAQSALHYSLFLESLGLHPSITISHLEVTFQDSLQQVRVYLTNN